MYFSEQTKKLVLNKNSIIVITITYSIKNAYNFSFQIKKIKQRTLKMYWQVVDCNASIDGDSFLISFSETIVRRVFCKKKTNLVQWRSIRLSLIDSPYQEIFHCELSLSTFVGELESASSSTIKIKLLSAQFPRQKFEFLLEGIPSDLDLKKSTNSDQIILLEHIFKNVIRIPYYAPMGDYKLRILDFALAKPTWYSSEDVRTSLDELLALAWRVKGSL